MNSTIFNLLYLFVEEVHVCKTKENCDKNIVRGAGGAIAPSSSIFDISCAPLSPENFDFCKN